MKRSKAVTAARSPRESVARIGRRTISPKYAKALEHRFLAEVLGVVGTSEIYGTAHDALFRGYFEDLKQYQEWGDFGIKMGLRQLSRPKPLHIFVDPGILYGFFRLWLRRQEINPETVVHPDWEVRFEPIESESASVDEDSDS